MCLLLFPIFWGGWNHSRIHNEISEASLAAGLWCFTRFLLKHLLRNTRGFGFGSSSIPGGPSQRNSPNWQMISSREKEVHSSHSPPAHVWGSGLPSVPKSLSLWGYFFVPMRNAQFLNYTEWWYFYYFFKMYQFRKFYVISLVVWLV